MNKRVQLLIIPIPEIVCPESFEIGIKKLSNVHSFIYAFSMEKCSRIRHLRDYKLS